MSQVYHSNARTNQHVREMIQKSDLTNVELANKYAVNVKTISKHRCTYRSIRTPCRKSFGHFWAMLSP